MTAEPGQILKIKHRHPEFGSIFTNAVDEALAARLPPLRLPPMPDSARAAFRALLDYEKPPANGSLVDVLQLVEARGYSAHPCDWIPDYSWQYAGRHPRLYQPWVDWLSEQRVTKFHQGNTLTAGNARRWSAGQRSRAVVKMIRDGRRDGFEAAKRFASTQPASIRAELAGACYAWGSFDGSYPWQTPLLVYFLDDRAEKVRAIAARNLEKMGSFTTAESYARQIADHLVVTADRVAYRDPPEASGMSFHLFKEFACVTFDILAAALGLAPVELARRADLEDVGKQLMSLAARTGDVEVRSMFATRTLDEGKGGEHIPLILFEGVSPELWERGLRAMMASPYANSVQEYLGSRTGTMDRATMREWYCSHYITQTVTAEIERGDLPVNIALDHLRLLGKVVDKAAAAEVLDEALAAGIKSDNPRLTMLKLNLAL